MCYHVPLVPDYGVLTRSFLVQRVFPIRFVTTLVWYLTSVCYHVSLVPDYGLSPRSFDT